MIKKRKKKVLTKNQIIIKRVCLGFLLVLFICFIISGIIMGIQLGNMNKQNSTAQDIEYGQERINTLTNSGVNIKYNIYTESEIENDKTKADVNLYYFPSSNAEKSKFVIICPGGSYTSCALDAEGYPAAAQLNELGYTVFVLKYRAGENGGDYAAVDDLAAAVKFVFDNADDFNVKTQEYALCGFSAGGNLVSLFATDTYGYTKYDNVQKPSMLMLGYPWCNLNTESLNPAKMMMYSVLNSMGYKGLLGDNPTKEEKLSMHIPQQINKNYPDVYIMHGTADVLVPSTTHSDVMADALKENGINYKYENAAGVNHGCGIGKGTSAENWLQRAVDFWENN